MSQERIKPTVYADVELRHSVSKREHLLFAAMRCISRLGFRKSTMEEIALEAGVTRVTIYREFGNRRALIEALAAHRLAAFNESFMASAGQFETIAAALEAYLLASTRTARENPITREIVRGSLGFTRAGAPLHTIMRRMWETLIRSTPKQDETAISLDIDGAVEWIMVTQHTLSRLVIESGLSDPQVTHVVRTYIAPAFYAIA